MRLMLTGDIAEEEQIDPDDIVGLVSNKCILGNGAFGEVLKVTWRRTPVAAKVARANMPESEKFLTLRELAVMTRIKHPNIVQFLGYVDEPFAIIIELVQGGNLKEFWKAHKLSSGCKTAMCIDVLMALNYLHNRKPNFILHRDVKPANILVTGEGVCKLTDFGLGRAFIKEDRSSFTKRQISRDNLTPHVPNQLPPPHMAPEVAPGPAADVSTKKSDLSTITGCVGTTRYMSPEANSNNYTSKADVYSAGVTFYELWEEAPFDMSRPFSFALTPSPIAQLLVRMGDKSPDVRPSAGELIDLFIATNLARMEKRLQPSLAGCCTVM